MSWAAEIAAAKRELLAYCKTALSQVFLYTLSAKASAVGDQDSVEAGDGAQSQQRVIRISPFGIRSVPPKNIRSLMLRLGGSNIFFIGIGPTTAYGPQDLGDGDAALYSKGNAELRATGDDLIANGGTAKVGRVGDKTVADAKMTTWISAVTTAVQSIDPALVEPTDFGVINQGADHLKA